MIAAPSVDPPTLAAVAAAFGLDPNGGEVVRAASRLVMRFPDAQVRTFAVPTGTTGPREEAAVAGLLADAGVPATRRVAGPIEVDGWSVTAWREIEVPDPPAPPADAAVVGSLAARLHRATAGLDRRGLTACDPLGAALAQLEAAVRAEATPESDLVLLRAHATRLERVWDDAVATATSLGPQIEGLELAGGSVVHGDLHPGNVVIGTHGPVLVDLELAGWGPSAFDAAPTVALVRWYGHPERDLAAFDAHYGAALTGEAVRRGLDEVWGLWSTAWAVANRHRTPAAAAEADVRVAAWADAPSGARWHLS